MWIVSLKKPLLLAGDNIRLCPFSNAAKNKRLCKATVLKQNLQTLVQLKISGGSYSLSSVF